MDPRCPFLTLGIPWTQSTPSRDVNAATRLAEEIYRRDNSTRGQKGHISCTEFNVSPFKESAKVDIFVY